MTVLPQFECVPMLWVYYLKCKFSLTYQFALSKSVYPYKVTCWTPRKDLLWRTCTKMSWLSWNLQMKCHFGQKPLHYKGVVLKSYPPNTEAFYVISTPYWTVLRIWDPGSCALYVRDPGWVKSQDPDPGWTTQTYFLAHRDHFLGLKYLNSLMRIRDPEWKKFGSGIGDKHPGDPQHCFWSVLLPATEVYCCLLLKCTVACYWSVLLPATEVYCCLLLKCTAACYWSVLLPATEVYCCLLLKCTVACYWSVLLPATEVYCCLLLKCTVACYWSVLLPATEVYCCLILKCTVACYWSVLLPAGGRAARATASRRTTCAAWRAGSGGRRRRRRPPARRRWPGGTGRTNHMSSSSQFSRIFYPGGCLIPISWPEVCKGRIRLA